MMAKQTYFAMLGSTALSIFCGSVAVNPAMAEAAAPAGNDQAASGSSVNPSTSPSVEVGEIIVTANKERQTIGRVGMSITAATGDQLVARGIQTTADLARIVPGLTVQDSAFSSVSYTLRGIGFFNSDLSSPPAVSIYVDEAPITYPAMTRLVSFDLERVEVLKGPQGTLFGQNSTGGAINYIAAKPTDTFKAGADVSYGRFNAVDFGTFISGPITQDIQARLAVKGSFGDAWQKSYTRDDKLGTKNQLAARLSLAIEPTSKLHISLVASGWRDRSDSLANQLIGVIPSIPAEEVAALKTYPLAPHNNRVADWSPSIDYGHNDYFYQFMGRIDYSLSDQFTLTSLTSYEHYRQRYGQDLDGTALELDHIQSADGRISSVSQELRLNANLGRAKLLVGGNYEHDVINDGYVTTYHDASAAKAFLPLIQADLNSSSGLYHVQTYSVFGRFSYQLTPTLQAAVSGRYNNDRRQYVGCAYDINGNTAGSLNVFYALIHGQPFPSTVPTTPFKQGDCYVLDSSNGYAPAILVREKLHQSNFSWRGELNWQVSPTTLLYANASRGFKAGTIPVLSASLTQQYAPVPQESVLALETGFKAKLLNRAVELTGALFYYNYRDKQLRGKIQDPIYQQLEALVTIPKSRVWGVELSGVITPFHGLQISPGVTYVNSKIQRFTGYSGLGVLGNYEGTPFPYSPKWQVVSDVQYTFPLNNGMNGFVGGDITYNSKTNAGVGTPASLYIKAYSLVDLRAGVETADQKYRFSIWGRNVFNTYYWSNDFLGLDALVRFAGKPATYGISAGVRF